MISYHLVRSYKNQCTTNSIIPNIIYWAQNLSQKESTKQLFQRKITQPKKKILHEKNHSLSFTYHSKRNYKLNAQELYLGTRLGNRWPGDSRWAMQVQKGKPGEASSNNIDKALYAELKKENLRERDIL